ncbi:hypothetical protein [Thaumasiovibrio sp. DFM-14]|uniref:hypothetical protein n=1 Tax=Thaumasiovibrio sp. DFM-14 TaxID=3384792 RepID=UPI0039A01F02
MVIKKMALTGAFFLLASAQAQQLSEMDNGWQLAFSTCSYGRGASAIADAKDAALEHAIRAFESQRLLLSKSESLPTNEQFIQRVHQEQDRFSYGSTYLQGSETCLPVHYELTIENSSDGLDWEWESDDGVQLRIQASSAASGQHSAVQAAEVAALRQGIVSALTGMVEDVSGFAHLAVVPQSIVKNWLVLERHEINGIATVIVEMELDEDALAELAQDHYQLVGQPRFLIHTDTPAIAHYLQAQMAERGWLSSQRVGDADIVIVAETSLNTADEHAQLGIHLSFVDKDGLQLGRWGNEARSLSLPIADDIQTRLANVHLNQNSEAVMHSVDSALLALHAAGGILREIALSRSANIAVVDLAQTLRQSPYVNSLKTIDDDGVQILQFRSRLSIESLSRELIALTVAETNSALQLSIDKDGRLLLN